MGLVAEGERLRIGADMYFVHADDIAHTKGVHVDLVRLALSVFVPPDHQAAARTDGLDRPAQGQGRAAGHVELSVVVGLHDLDVGVRKGLRRLPLCEMDPANQARLIEAMKVLEA